MRFFRCLLLVASLSIITVVSPAPVAAQASDCDFVLGFKTLHDLIPDRVGECKTNEYHNPQNGDGLQDTTGGLLVWRKADNWTAFTNGLTTWINGPRGLQQRLNTERFPWEVPEAAPAVAPYQSSYKCDFYQSERIGLAGWGSYYVKDQAKRGTEIHTKNHIYPVGSELTTVVYDSKGTVLAQWVYKDWSGIWYVVPYDDVFTVRFYNPSATQKTVELEYWLCGVW